MAEAKAKPEAWKAKAVRGGVGHALVGSFPLGGSQYETYRGMKRMGAGKPTRIGLAAVSTAMPMIGTASGAYRGYAKHVPRGTQGNMYQQLKPHHEAFHQTKNSLGAHEF